MAIVDRLDEPSECAGKPRQGSQPIVLAAVMISGGRPK